MDMMRVYYLQSEYLGQFRRPKQVDNGHAEATDEDVDEENV